MCPVLSLCLSAFTRGLSLNLELSGFFVLFCFLAHLSGQQAPGTLLSASPASWQYNEAPPCPAFVGSGD